MNLCNLQCIYPLDSPIFSTFKDFPKNRENSMKF